MIQKIKLKFTHSVNLGPIIVNIITKNKYKIDVPVVTELATSCLPAKPAFQQASNILICHYLICLFKLSCQLSTLIGPHRFLSTLFENSYPLAFKLVLQNNFHGISSTVVRIFSSQCVFLNCVLWLTASLRTLPIYPPIFPHPLPTPPPPKKKKKKKDVSVFPFV